MNVDKLDFIKIKNYPTNITIKKVKLQSIEWEKIFVSHLSDKD